MRHDARVVRRGRGPCGHLSDETAAVVGYGIQGRAQAKNLRDSGCSVIVGNREDEYRATAEGDGLPVSSIGEAAAGALVLFLIPDREIRDGSLARSLVGEQRAGYPNLKSKFDQARPGPMTETEESLRRMLRSPAAG